MMKTFILSASLLLLPLIPQAQAANCWVSPIGMKCSPGWSFHDGREWREERREEWREEHRRPEDWRREEWCRHHEC